MAFGEFRANQLRNNLSYGFAIAGFIVRVTLMLSHTLSAPRFDIAVARVSECVLAAMVTAVVNVLFAPTTAMRHYFNSRIAPLRDLGRELTGLALQLAAVTGRYGTNDDPHRALRALARRLWHWKRRASTSAARRRSSPTSTASHGARLR